jgi:hypothetical protein
VAVDPVLFPAVVAVDAGHMDGRNTAADMAAAV